jgi:hypothetical protein
MYVVLCSVSILYGKFSKSILYKTSKNNTKSNAESHNCQYSVAHKPK